jgi:predicted component of type VI protein secretion system
MDWQLPDAAQATIGAHSVRPKPRPNVAATAESQHALMTRFCQAFGVVQLKRTESSEESISSAALPVAPLP